MISEKAQRLVQALSMASASAADDRLLSSEVNDARRANLLAECALFEYIESLEFDAETLRLVVRELDQRCAERINR